MPVNMTPQSTELTDDVSIGARLRAVSGRKWLQRLLSVLISVGLLGLVLYQVDWASFAEYWSRLSSGALFVSFALYLMLNVFRALRYQALLAERNLPLSALMPITLYHNFLVRILPFKLGEISYIVLLRQRHKVPTRLGISSLFGARLLELLVIVLVAVLALLVAGDILPAEQNAILLVLMLACVVLGVASLYYSGTLLRLLSRPLGSAEQGWRLKLAKALSALALELDALRQGRRFAWSFLWSWGTYLCSALSVLVTLWAIGARMNVLETVIVLSLGMFAMAFPFNISGFGLVDWSWAFGLHALAGMALDDAVAAGFMLNATQMLFAVIAGIAGWAILRAHPSPTLAITET
jgi:uncharacterized membrane protein YbhN (UPF0104 family)